MVRVTSFAVLKISVFLVLFFTFFILANCSDAVAQDANNTTTQNPDNVAVKEQIRDFITGDVVDKFVNGNKKELILGFRVDSAPISDENSQGYAGFCNVFADELQASLRTYVDRELRRTPAKLSSTEIDSKVEAIKVVKIGSANFSQGGSYERFAGVTGKVQKVDDLRDVECGANSIRRLGDVDFSKEFFKTGISILTKKSNIEKIRENETDLRKLGLTIGVIPETTTYDWLLDIRYDKIRSNYRLKADLIQGLTKGDVEAIASDYIFLKYFLENPRSKLNEEYELYDKYLSSQYYGLVFRKNQSNLKGIIDSLISPESAPPSIKSEIDYLNKHFSLSTAWSDIALRFLALHQKKFLSLVVFFGGLMFVRPVREKVFGFLNQFWEQIKPDFFNKLWQFLSRIIFRN